MPRYASEIRRLGTGQESFLGRKGCPPHASVAGISRCGAMGCASPETLLPSPKKRFPGAGRGPVAKAAVTECCRRHSSPAPGPRPSPGKCRVCGGRYRVIEIAHASLALPRRRPGLSGEGRCNRALPPPSTARSWAPAFAGEAPVWIPAWTTANSATHRKRGRFPRPFLHLPKPAGRSPPALLTQPACAARTAGCRR
jgi:hypothetical protein